MTDRVRAVRLAATQETIDLKLLGPDGKESDLVKKARREFRTSLLARSDYPETHLHLGGLALTRRNLAAADAAFAEALRQDPQNTDAWIMRSRIAIASRRRQRAIELLQKGVVSNNQSAPLLRALGRAQMAAGRFDQAITSLGKARSMDAKMPSISIDIARAWLGKGNIEGAIAELSNLNHVGQQTPQSAEFLAVLLGRAGRFSEAAQVARELIDRYPSYRPNSAIRELLRFKGAN